MILQQLKQALEHQGWVEQRNLMRRFNLSEDALDSMLSIWMRRGLVVRNSAAGCSGGCGCGDASGGVQYRWAQAGTIGIQQN